MREYFLIPKHAYRPSQKTPPPSPPPSSLPPPSTLQSPTPPSWKTSIPPPGTSSIAGGIQVTNPILPPPKRPRKQRPSIFLRELDYNLQDRRIKPSLGELIPYKINNKGKIGPAKTLLKHFEKNDNLQWSQEGDLYQPITGINILDIIYDITSNKTQFSDKEIAIIKHILLITNTPISFIINKRIKDEIIKASFNIQQPSTPKRKPKRKNVLTWRKY